MDLYNYDSAGNLLYDNLHHYFYDAENPLIQVDGSLPYCTSNGASGSAATACYYYDADGKRVWRTGYTNDNCDNTGKRGYVFDLAGHVIVETNGSGTDCDLQVYAGDRHFGRQGGGSYFYHSDWLGTVRKIISDQFLLNSGVQTCTSLPFGDGLNCNSNASNVWHFTGQERDYETGSGTGAQNGLDYFHARHYTSSMGHFLSPDPQNVGASPDNPQSWNAYAYVLDNPLAIVDPSGLDCIYIDNDSGAYLGFNRGDCDNSTDQKANTGNYVDGTVNTIFTTTGDDQGVVTGYSGINKDDPNSPISIYGNFYSGAAPPPSDALNPFAQGVFGQLDLIFNGSKAWQNCMAQQTASVNNNWFIKDFSLLAVTRNPGPFGKSTAKSVAVKAGVIATAYGAGGAVSGVGRGMVAAGSLAEHTIGGMGAMSYGESLIAAGNALKGGGLFAAKKGVPAVGTALTAGATAVDLGNDLHSQYVCRAY